MSIKTRIKNAMRNSESDEERYFRSTRRKDSLDNPDTKLTVFYNTPDTKKSGVLHTTVGKKLDDEAKIGGNTHFIVARSSKPNEVRKAKRMNEDDTRRF